MAQDTPLAEKGKVFIDQWLMGMHIRHIAHNKCFSRYKRLDRFVGLTATILAALVSTTVIVSFTKSGSLCLQAIAASFSVLATIFASANTFLKYGELAAKHELTAASYGQLRRELELAESYEGALTKDFLEQLMNKWGELDKASPDIPQSIYRSAKNDAEEDEAAALAKNGGVPLK